MDTAALDDWTSVDKDLQERVTELSGLECRGYGEEYTDGIIRILVATRPNTDEAEKALERRKGEVHVDNLVDVDTDWDQAQLAPSDTGTPALLVQHHNLDLVIEVAASEKTREKFSADAAEKALVKVATSMIQAVEKTPK